IRTIAREPNSSPSEWSGHVFVESFVDGRWRLVDPVHLLVYDEYDPRIHLLPGGRWAYDKGADPGSLTLSLDKDNWIAQTRSFFHNFDLRQLPPEGRPLLSLRKLFAVADSPHWQQLRARSASIGMVWSASGNTHFERW